VLAKKRGEKPSIGFLIKYAVEGVSESSNNPEIPILFCSPKEGLSSTVSIKVEERGGAPWTFPDPSPKSFDITILKNDYPL
jgi:hypothetical protein